MSSAFSKSPPVYSTGNQIRSISNLGLNPINNSITTSGLVKIPETIYRDSLQSAVFDKIRDRLNELTQIGKAQIDSLKKTEQDLINGENQIELFIENAQSQQIQIQVCFSFLFH